MSVQYPRVVRFLLRETSRFDNVPSTSFLRVSLTRASITDSDSHVTITSTNRRLEGIHRRNWWGFAGIKSADAALHEKFLNLAAKPDLQTA